MKIRKHRLLFVFFATFTLVFNSIITPNSAFAGELTTLGVKVSWSDPLYEAPTSQRSTQYLLEYTTPDGVLKGDVSIVNIYGAVLNAAGLPTGFSGIKGAHSGSFTVLVFNSDASPLNWTGTKICLEVTLRSGAGTSTVCKSVTFLQQNSSPSPTASVKATPAPAPTVTVTATPAPAATVYLTNPSDKTLSDLVALLKNQVNKLNAKVKKICAVKPKPKGC
jgi:hypothetical protein